MPPNLKEDKWEKEKENLKRLINKEKLVMKILVVNIIVQVQILKKSLKN